VLALLEDGDRYGYDLVSQLGAHGLIASEGTVYPLLSRLRREGAVETAWVESTSGPPRRYYRLAAQGKHTLNRFRESWSEFRDSVETILNKGTTP
jgi:PadR family transcriptional regulator